MVAIDTTQLDGGPSTVPNTATPWPTDLLVIGKHRHSWEFIPIAPRPTVSVGNFDHGSFKRDHHGRAKTIASPDVRMLDYQLPAGAAFVGQ